jgi:uncharacterized protein (DUF1778 family)
LPQERTLIARAAEAVNQNVPELVLSAARKRAEEVLRDRRTFLLDEERYRAFVEALDAPSRDNSALARLLKRNPLWER